MSFLNVGLAYVMSLMGRMGEGYESEGNEMEFDREVFLQAPFSVSGKESWLGVWGGAFGGSNLGFSWVFFLFLQSLLSLFLDTTGPMKRCHQYRLLLP